ncbi:hypothetical protein M0813_13170 [Anaeramoeba flamelloides]|uniref:Uncharacterized protein n=1 Tax=Anaeramoeba flamelloides TaxID=1746091 RepID=A0AAV8A645_9EUKA|nr:hypothetical protein M0812_05873 [Anaeramoeba flamelloides]KAJ6253753.1 hypothetical protein M0813_13170 [Anaeramoeba flamelloides]
MSQNSQVHLDEYTKLQLLRMEFKKLQKEERNLDLETDRIKKKVEDIGEKIYKRNKIMERTRDKYDELKKLKTIIDQENKLSIQLEKYNEEKDMERQSLVEKTEQTNNKKNEILNDENSLFPRIQEIEKKRIDDNQNIIELKNKISKQKEFKKKKNSEIKEIGEYNDIIINEITTLHQETQELEESLKPSGGDDLKLLKKNFKLEEKERLIDKYSCLKRGCKGTLYVTNIHVLWEPSIILKWVSPPKDTIHLMNIKIAKPSTNLMVDDSITFILTDKKSKKYTSFIGNSRNTCIEKVINSAKVLHHTIQKSEKEEEEKEITIKKSHTGKTKTKRKKSLFSKKK